MSANVFVYFLCRQKCLNGHKIKTRETHKKHTRQKKTDNKRKKIKKKNVQRSPMLKSHNL